MSEPMSAFDPKRTLRILRNRTSVVCHFSLAAPLKKYDALF